MVHALGLVTLKTAHGAFTVLRTGRYAAMCLHEDCSWQGPERDLVYETDDDLLQHQHYNHLEEN